MTSARSHIACAALLTALSAAAFAQPSTTPAPAGSTTAPEAQRRDIRGHDPAYRAERFERHMAQLKQKLQIGANQEAAWSSFTGALRPQARPQRPDREALTRMSTPDRIDHLRALRTERLAEMDRRGEATKAFYATLSAEQKKVFDESTLRWAGHRRHGHHG